MLRLLPCKLKTTVQQQQQLNMYITSSLLKALCITIEQELKEQELKEQEGKA